MPSPANQMRKWFSAVDAVSELLRDTWANVFSLPALDFLTYIKYYNYKQRKREQQMEQFRRSTKNGRH